MDEAPRKANRYSPLNPIDEHGAIAGEGLISPSPTTPQTETSMISEATSSGSFAEEVRRQHQEFKAKMDELMAAASTEFESPPGLSVPIPPVPARFRSMQAEARELIEGDKYIAPNRQRWQA